MTNIAMAVLTMGFLDLVWTSNLSRLWPDPSGPVLAPQLQFLIMSGLSQHANPGLAFEDRFRSSSSPRNVKAKRGNTGCHWTSKPLGYNSLCFHATLNNGVHVGCHRLVADNLGSTQIFFDYNLQKFWPEQLVVKGSGSFSPGISGNPRLATAAIEHWQRSRIAICHSNIIFYKHGVCGVEMGVSSY